MGRNGGTRLELTWIGKDDRPRPEPRILIEDSEKSYHAAVKRAGDIFDNILIQGDNLLALKALEADYADKVKCVFIDPPFNTGSAFEHYNDGLEHSLWLSLMRDRLEVIHRLLCGDGFIFVQIDYRESARLKLLLDEVFGPTCFRNEIIVGRGTKNVQSQFEDIDALSSCHDTIYLYSKSPTPRLPKLFAKVGEPQPGKWDTFWRGTDRPTMRYNLFGQTPDRGQWRWSKDRAYAAKKAYEEYLKSHAERLSLDEYWREIESKTGEEPNFVRLGPDNNVQYYVGPRDYKLLSDVWIDIRTLGKQTSFPHEKHEELLERIIGWVTKPGDLVLDSFAGSGTTGAVAHKMGRRWIMVELGDHAVTHIVPRLKKVINGEDKGGVTEATGWQGGGGFRFYHLAPSLLEKDKWGNWVIAKTYNAAMLAEAMCRHMGFTYEPSQDVAEYWKHGHSSEHDFIFITTASLTHNQLKAISHDVGPDRTLLICCKAFNARLDDFENLTVKKIPHTILNRCEWGRDDYSLEIANLPSCEPDNSNGDSDGDAPNGRKRGREKAADSQPTLFSEEEA